MKYIFYISAVLITGLLVSCTDELEKLTPPEERVASAIGDLTSKLIASTNGWVLNYQPTNTSGNFYMVLDFNEDGTVNIQSDVSADNGDYYDHTIPYRIDSKLGIELIFETYGVFHFMFEQNRSSFGAEFEFVYVDEVDGNLVFASKSDGPDDLTVISLEPASSSAGDVFSRELAENLVKYDTISSGFIGPLQQIALLDQGVSIFWSINLAQRSIEVRSAAVGTTIVDVVANDLSVLINHNTGFGLYNGKLVLNNPFSFDLDGQNYTISEITLDTYSETGEILCAGGTLQSPVYSGSVAGLGIASMNKTLFDVEGAGFIPSTDQAYSVNVLFVVDAIGFSLSQNGSINEFFPTATGFAFNYGYDNSNAVEPQPAYAVGLYYEDDAGDSQVVLREFVATTTVDNYVDVVFMSNYYPSTISAEDQANIESITDEIFGVGGGRIYSAYLPIEGRDDLTVYSLYNSCNNYEFLLVK